MHDRQVGEGKAPAILLSQPRRHREQVADRDPLASVMRARPLGQVTRDWVFQGRDPAFVKRDAREQPKRSLGHGIGIREDSVRKAGMRSAVLEKKLVASYDDERFG